MSANHTVHYVNEPSRQVSCYRVTIDVGFVVQLGGAWLTFEDLNNPPIGEYPTRLLAGQALMRTVGIE